ncbi:hypothetical protein [Hymenobacter sp.]
MAQQLLNNPDICPGFQQVSSLAVSQHVQGNWSANTSPFSGLFYYQL